MNCYLHHFCRSDDDRALHDHPWHFWSLILKGEYVEHTAQGAKLRQAGSWAHRRPEVLHRVELFKNLKTGLEDRCWTLVITGPKIRNWGFLCPRGWVAWEVFDAANGCGEYA